MNLIFYVNRNFPAFVTEIKFDGNEIFSNDELANQLKICLKDRWTIFQKNLYEYCLQKDVREYLAAKGYIKSKIGLITPKLVSNSYIIEIPIKEGIRYRLGDIKIKGSKVFTQKELLKMSELESGAIINRKMIHKFFFDILNDKYSDKGYIEYDVGLIPKFIEPSIDGLDGIVNLTAEIDEGTSFKIKGIKFLGVNSDEERKLKEFLKLKEGDVYNQSKFKESIKKINESKEFHLIDFDREVEIRDVTETVEKYFINKNPLEPRLLIRKAVIIPEIQIVIRIKKLTEDERKYYQELSKRRN